MRISRKAAATTAIAGLVLALSACSSSDSGASALDSNADLSTQTLTISNWAAYYPEDLAAKFEEKFDILKKAFFKSVNFLLKFILFKNF